MTGGDRGAVTVEAAFTLLSIVLVLAMVLAGFSAALAAVRCGDAAHELARLAARGDADRGRTVADRLAPSGATVTLTVEGDEVVAEVSAPAVRPLPLRISGRAVAVLEPGVVAA